MIILNLIFLVSAYCLRVRARAVCLDVIMKDSHGDGWKDAEYTIASAKTNEVLATGTFLDGSAQTDEVCLNAGCYALSVSAGSFPEEISWSLASNSGIFLNGSAPFSPWRFELSEEGGLTAGCSLCSCDSCVHIEIESGAAYELVSSVNNSLISRGLIGTSSLDTICVNGDECYTLEVTGTGNWSIGRNNFAGSTPYGPTHLTITDDGFVSQGCNGATCSSCNSTCVQVKLTSAAVEGGGVSYKLREVGVDHALATWILLPGELDIATAVCVDLPGGCHRFEVSGTGYWSIGDLSGDAPYGPLYVTIEEDGTLVEGCDEDYIGVCEKSSCEADCDVDYINLGIRCTDLEFPEAAFACVCIGATDCQSCPSGSTSRLLTEDELARFIRNGTAVSEDDAPVQSVMGIEIISVAAIVQQGFSLHVEGDNRATARLDGAGTTRLFVVESDARLSMAQLTIQNGYADGAAGGGCILMGSYAKLRLEGVIVENCTALLSGGVVATYSRSMVVATNIYVYHGIASSGSGGGFFSNDGSWISVFNSTFDECLAALYGGSFSVGKEGIANLHNVTIRHSSALHWGGGVYGDKSSIIKVSGSRIEESSANFGGGFYGFTQSRISINKTDFVNCQAWTSGGGVYGDKNSTVEVTESRIEKCSAEFGGGVFTESQVSVNNSEILNCSATKYGGGVLSSFTSLIEVTDSRIENCSADFGGGFSVFTQSRISISSSDIVNCQASRAGGGAYGHESSVIEVTNSRIEECSAEFGGGLLVFHESRLSINKTDFVNCQAWTSGGGVYGDKNSTIEVTESRIEKCSAEFGGGIFTGSQVSVNNSEILNCSATKYGGGVQSSFTSLIEVTNSRIENCSAEFGGGLNGHAGSRISISSSDIVNCQASRSGGGAYGYINSVIEVTNSRIENCSAHNCGGLHGHNGSKLFISSTNIANCQARMSGGGVCGNKKSTIEATQSRIEKCSAEFGGGVFTESQISIKNTEIVSCRANQFGGGANVNENAVIEVTDSRIEYCLAESGGGLIGHAGSQISISNSDIVNCQGRKFGGGINGDENSVIEVANSRIENCIATEAGGGIYGFSRARISISSSDIVNCQTSRFGGAIYAYERAIAEVVDSRIENCSAISGGGLFGQNRSRISINNTTIARCQGSQQGGGVYVYMMSIVEVTNSRIEDCLAKFGGGLYGDTGSRISINDTIIVNCEASQEGGGVYGKTATLIELVDSQVIDCTAAYHGGALCFLARSRCVIYKSRLKRNSAIYGGAINSFGADIISIGDGVVIENNEAENNGGSINAINEGDGFSYILVSTSKCTWVILEHDFESDGATGDNARTVLYSQSNRSTNDARGRSTLSYIQPGRKSKYAYCLAPGDYTFECYDTASGGWGTGSATLKLMSVPREDNPHNSDFTCHVSSGNHVDAYSFVLPAPSSNRESSEPLFRGNKATVGGSIFAEGVGIFMVDAIIIDNTARARSADDGGGAISIKALTTLDVTRSLFSNNSAQSALGGAVHCGFGSQVQVEDCTALENVAQYGGFISLLQTKNVSIASTTIMDNKASSGIGAGLYSRAQLGESTTINTTFRNNTAIGPDSAGGAVGVQDGFMIFESTIFEENVVRAGLGGGGIALFNSDAEFKETDDCISLEIYIDFRTTNQVCGVYNQGVTCENFIESCSELEAKNDGDTVCAGCACDGERGVSIIGTQSGAKSTDRIARGYAAALHSTSFCLESNESYQISAFDELGRGLDGGSWSVVFLNHELPLHIAGFGDIFTTPDGATHYLGASFDGDISPEITFRVAPKDPKFSIFRSNHAEGGGGGAIYIDQGIGSSDAMPSGLERNVRFEGNSAAYGSDTASPPRFVGLRSSQTISLASGGIVDPDNILIVQLLDQYNQTAARSSKLDYATIEVFDVISSAGTSVIFENGYAVFSNLLITRTPGTNVTAIISTNVDSLEPEKSSLIAIINLLKCVSGEEQTKTQCIACPESEYSFYPEEPCHECPDRGTCRGRNSIIPDRGFWKSAFDSTNIRRCPRRQACNSNNETDLIADTSGTNLHPNAQCASNHRGPLCATCEHKYFLTSGECRDCRASHRRDAIIALTILAIAILLIGAFMEVSGCRKGCYAAISIVIPYLSDIQSVVKQVVVFYDVTSKLSQSFPSVRVPPVFADFQIICAVFGLDIALYLRQACIYSFDHIDLLYGVTLIPLALIGMGSLFYLAIRQRWTMERRIKVFSTFSFALLVFIYLILTTTSSIIIRTLQCDDDFDDTSEEAHSPYYQDSYLYADYNVSCRTRRWRVAKVYAIFMLFVYPIGIPFFDLVCLLSIKSLIAPSDARKVADATIEKDCPPIASGESIEECRPYDRRDERHGTLSLKIRVRAAVSYLHNKRNDRRVQQWKDARQLAVAYVDEDNAIKKFLSDNTATSNFQRVANDRESIRKARLLTLRKHLVKETRVLEKACWPYKFLFDGYGITSWFWEVFECFRRIVLTCLLPFPGSDTDSFSQYILGAVFALSFGFAYACFRPFDSSEINSLAIFVQLLIILNYMAMMLLYVDQNLSDEDDTTGLKSKHVGWFLITTNAILLPICSIIVCTIECKKHAAFFFHQQSGRLPLELTALSSNQYTIEDEKDECEDPRFIRVISERNDDEATGISEVDHPDVQHDSTIDVLQKNDNTLNQDFDEDTSA